MKNFNFHINNFNHMTNLLLFALRIYLVISIEVTKRHIILFLFSSISGNIYNRNYKKHQHLNNLFIIKCKIDRNIYILAKQYN